MLSRLGQCWISLWRRTDYLGFPAFGYLLGNRIDLAAEETDGSGTGLVVNTHSNYPRTMAFDRALEGFARSDPCEMPDVDGVDEPSR